MKFGTFVIAFRFFNFSFMLNICGVFLNSKGQRITKVCFCDAASGSTVIAVVFHFSVLRLLVCLQILIDYFLNAFSKSFSFIKMHKTCRYSYSGTKILSFSFSRKSNCIKEVFKTNLWYFLVPMVS